MRRRRRAAPLPPDRGLQARMVIAMLLAPAIALVGVGVAIAVPVTRLPVILVVAAGVLRLSIADAEPRWRMVAPALAPRDLPHVHAIVDRLCLVADMPKPEIVVEREDQPNSWIEAPGGGTARLHLTLGLLFLLEPEELEAVIAHELAHLAHHDARVMGIVGGSGELLLDGAQGATRLWFFLWPGILAAGALGWISRLTTLSFARHRELVADAGSAALTGRPAALARALRRISGELARIPSADLREAAARDVLHLVPVAGEALNAPWTTHPPLARRIERLERLERALHAARPVAPDVARGRADR
jgi:heat shock protein HtpX